MAKIIKIGDVVIGNYPNRFELEDVVEVLNEMEGYENVEEDEVTYVEEQEGNNTVWILTITPTVEEEEEEEEAAAPTVAAVAGAQITVMYRGQVAGNYPAGTEIEDIVDALNNAGHYGLSTSNTRYVESTSLSGGRVLTITEAQAGTKGC